MTITDEMLYEAAPRAAELFLETLPGREDCVHAFSRGFEAKMRPLLAGRRQARRWGRILLIAAALTALLCVSVGAIRGAVFQMSRSESELSGVQYTFRTMDALGAFQPAEIGYLPEGYEQTREDFKETETYTRYIRYFENGEGGLLYVCQYLSDRLSVGLGDRSDYTLKHPEIHGTEAELYLLEEEGLAMMIWVEGDYIMEISGLLSEEEIVKIAENITWK
nr:DUF4367 domain-containing protein [uncultured Dysosmobacter sp.]